MNIAILGNGAIANLLCWQSHRTQINYVNFVRGTPSSPLICQTPDGQTVKLNSKIVNLAEVRRNEIDQQIIFMPFKAYQILPALKQYSQCFDNHSTLVLLHNGMIDLNEVSKLIPDNPIITATTSNGAFKPETNKVCITGVGSTQAGWIRRSANAESIEKQLNKLLPPCYWSSNIEEILWLKLAVNAVINPLTALHSINNGELNRLQYQGKIAAISDEIAAIMSQLGYQVCSDLLINNALKVITATASNFSSMHQDIAKGRRTEIDNINGYVCAEGARLNLPTPINKEMAVKIRQLENPGKN